MASMADHLRSQEYERVRHSKSMLSESRLSDEDAARLVEAYERNDTSAADYLAIVTENRPFTPPPTTHVVVIDSGTYCASVAMSVVFNSFLQDHGNQVVQELLSRYEVALVEKAPRAFSSTVAPRKQRGDFKFYLDVFELRSTATANNLFMGLAQLGARPFFLTPRDVNMDAHVTTSTWRFYFGQDEAHACLKVRGFVTNQLVYGRKFFIAPGKRSEAPPTRAAGIKNSPYSVELPISVEAHLNTPPAPGEQGAELAPARRSCVDTLPRRDLEPHAMPVQSEISPRQQERLTRPNGAKTRRVLEIEAERQSGPVEESNELDVEMQSTPSEEDVDMIRHLETGFKRVERTESSFSDENPYSALEVLDCDFEAFEPTTTADWTAGVLMVPHLSSTGTTQEAKKPLPTKRRSTGTKTAKLVAEESVLVTAEETELESREDRVAQNTQHLKPVEKLLQTSKNMDKIVESISAMPTAWSTAFCTDLARGGKNVDEVASVHLLNRIFAANDTLGAEKTFNQRVIGSHLPLGKTRSTYVKYIAGELEQQSTQAKTQWGILRLLSAFELLLRSMTPFLAGSSKWVHYLIGENDIDMSCGHDSLLSDQTLLQLLRSRVGTQLLTTLLHKLPTSTLLMDLQALSCSDLSAEELPSISVDSLSSASETALTN